MKGTTWVTVELWDETDDGSQMAQQYDVECSYYCAPGTRDEPAEFDVEIINFNGIDPKTNHARLIENALHDLNWDNILAELSWLNY